MKKFLMLIMMSMFGFVMIIANSTIMLRTSAATTQVIQTTAWQHYDLNGDQKLNAIDLSLLKQKLVAGEGAYRLTDAVKLKRFLLGEISSFSEIVEPGVKHRVTQVQEYDFSNNVASDEDVNIVRNILCMDGQQTVSYTDGVLTIDKTEDSNLIISCKIAEGNGTCSDEDVVVTATLSDGGNLFIYVDEDGFLKAAACLITKPAVAWVVTSLEVTDENTVRLVQIFEEGTLVEAQNDGDAIVLCFDTPEAEVYLEFKTQQMRENSKNATCRELLAKAKVEGSDVIQMLYNNGVAYEVCAIA